MYQRVNGFCFNQQVITGAEQSCFYKLRLISSIISASEKDSRSEFLLLQQSHMIILHTLIPQ